METTPRTPSRRRLATLLAAGATGLALTAVVTSPASAIPAPGTGCAAVHVITARASTEAPGEGVTGALVTQIVNDSRQTVSRASVNYPATLNNYANSSAQGVSALKTQLTNQVNACPSQKIVLAGYSQGAHVVLDVLGGGGGGSLGATTPPISSAVASHVTAVATFGDPRHVVNQAFDLGTSRRNGLFPRSNTQLGVLAGFANRIHAWCDSNDTFCDSGNSVNVHLTYLNRYQNAASTFVIGLVGG
ncbi:MAG: cutinase family protein [Labedaea sp.]